MISNRRSIINLKSFLCGNEENATKDGAFWNIVAGGVNAMEAVIFMMLVSRVCGVDEAGIFSIAFAIGNLFMCIGKYGVRNFQVTDSTKKYNFSMYFTVRVLTTFFMLLISVFYIVAKTGSGAYDINKALIIGCICMIYCVESVEDVFLGDYQAKGRLDIASKIFIIRWIIIIIAFTISILLLREASISIVIAFICSVIIEYALLRMTIGINHTVVGLELSEKTTGVLKECFALFIFAFMMYYITNAPKYAIDMYLNEEIQAYFGCISMPVFVIELLNYFFYQPQMVSLADDWEKNNFIDLNKRIRLQAVVIFMLTFVCVIGAYLVGTPMLSLVFGIDVTPFRIELVLFMIAGGFLAVMGYASVLLTIMRRQNMLMYGIVVIALLAFLGFGKIVQYYGMMGAAIYYMLLIFLLSLYYCCLVFIFMRRKKKV